MVPGVTPSVVSDVSSGSDVFGTGAASLAKPKSSTLTRPRLVTKRFAGLMSRWIMPLVCAVSSASATSMPHCTNCVHGIRPALMRCFTVCPSRSSITMTGFPSYSSTSYKVQMLGWLSAETVRASCSKRNRALLLAASDSSMTLIATRRPRRRSSAS